MDDLSSEASLYYERGIPCVFVSLQFKAKIVLPSRGALENEDGDYHQSSRREREEEEAEDGEEEEGEKKTKQGQQRQEEEGSEREAGKEEEETDYKRKDKRLEIRKRRIRSCRVRLSQVEGVLDDLSSTASGYFVCKLHKLLKSCSEENEDNEEKKKKTTKEEEQEDDEREERSPSSVFDRYTCRVFGSLDEVSDFLCRIGELYLVITPMKEAKKKKTYSRQKKDRGNDLSHPLSSSPPPSSSNTRTSSIRLPTPLCVDSKEELPSGEASRQPRRTDRRVSFSSLPPLSQSPSSHGEEEEEKKDTFFKPSPDLLQNTSPSEQDLVTPSGSLKEEENEEEEEEERYVTFSLKELFENGSLSVPSSSSLHHQHPFSSSSSLYFYNEVQLDPGDDGTLLWASLYLQEYLVPYGLHRSHPSLPSVDTGYPFLLSLSVIQNRSVRTLLQGGGAAGGGGGKDGFRAPLQQDEQDNRHDSDEKKRKLQGKKKRQGRKKRRGRQEEKEETRKDREKEDKSSRRYLEEEEDEVED